MLDLTQYYPNVKLTEKKLVYVRIFIVPLILEFGCRAIMTFFEKENQAKVRLSTYG